MKSITAAMLLLCAAAVLAAPLAQSPKAISAPVVKDLPAPPPGGPWGK